MERFRLDSGTVTGYDRSLDLRTGLLTRTVDWISPAGHALHLVFERLVDLSDSRRALVRARMSAGSPVTVRARAGLSVHVENGGLLHWDLARAVRRRVLRAPGRPTRGTGHTLAAACEVVAHDGDRQPLAGRPCDGRRAGDRT